MKRRILSLILTVSMLFALSLPIASVQAANLGAVITVDATKPVYQGSVVTISVKVEPQTGMNVMGAQVDFEYSTNFPQIASEDGGTKIVNEPTGWMYTGIESNALLAISDGKEEVGEILGNIVFTVPQDAPIDTEYVCTVKDVIIEDTQSNQLEYQLNKQEIKIIVEDLPSIEGITETDYSGTYDGKPHTGSVTVPQGAQIMYGTAQGDYTLNAPATFTDAGEHKLYYKVTKEGFKPTYDYVDVTIAPKALTNAMVKDINSMVYTGAKIEPLVEVTDGNPSLITDNDYDVTYGENTNVATGGSVTVTAKNNYTGTVQKPFAITPALMTIEEDDYEGTFDGVAHKADVDVTTPANALVKYGTQAGVYDLDVMPKYTDAGTYTVYYKATATNYQDATGSVVVKIEQKELTSEMVSDFPDVDYSGERILPQVAVRDGVQNIITQDDYDVTYGNNVNVKEGGSVTVTGKGNYKGTVTKTFNINPIPMVLSAEGYSNTYDGAAHSGVVNVTEPASAKIMYGTQDGTYTLEAMPQYTNAGTYTVYYKATDDNYIASTGSFTVEITQKALTENMLEDITAQEYTGEQIKPQITVRDGNPSVITADDYDVAYGDNLNVAEGGSVTITGKRNYTGTVTKNFEIANAVLRGEKTDYSGTFDAQPHKAAVTITSDVDADIKYTTTEGGEYTLTEMPEFTNAGNYTVYFKATAENYSDYTGSVLVNIAPKALTEAMVSDVADAVYTSVAIQPQVEVTDGDPSIISTEDYDITYGENINVATGGTVTVTAKRNYTGTVSKQFNITKAPLTVSTENKTITYGESVTMPVYYSGFAGTETEAVLDTPATVTGYRETPDAGEYPLTLSGATAANYEISYDNTSKLTVNKKDITLTTLNVFDKEYDETKDAVINDATAVFADLVAGDNVLLDIANASAQFAQAEEGDNVAVSITGLAIKGEDSANYNLTTTEIATTANIKAQLTAADVAAQITNVVVDRYQTKLTMPTVPQGFTVTLKSTTDEDVISSNLAITTSDISDQAAILVFAVAAEDGTDTSDTSPITVTVPKSEKYNVSVVSEGNGTISGGGAFVKYTTATVTATPDTGYTFDGWYEAGIKVSSAQNYTFQITSDRYLSAKFVQIVYSPGGGGGSGSPSKYNIRFETNGGNNIKTVSVKKNAAVDALPTPVREGYKFEGWYTDSKLTNKFDESTAITKTYTLYAKWTKIEDADEKETQDKPATGKLPFADVAEGSWYYENVKYVYEKGLFAGISETEFAPNSPLTRGMLVTVLHRAADKPAANNDVKFSDVNGSDYYYDAVKWAQSNGVVMGVSDDEFAPQMNVTREQMAVIIYRYAVASGASKAEAELDYEDLANVSEWAIEAVKFCTSNGLMSGSDGRFNPQSNATRAEASAILQRYFK